ncbi:hypothetical protein [Bacillus wiedmannii]|uniref:hypothetical protein n=1 Tax=Bacillus wiedmannii TaxID=1890302 RepID=UPI003D95F491
MSQKTEYIRRVSKGIQKWINNKYPESGKVRVNGDRGPFSRFSNDDLVDIALEVKKELRGEVINPSVLEQATGGIIGRQIWRRRISEEIERINMPVIDGREFGVTEHDEINHVNIEYIVERYSSNPRELVNQLYHLEESRIRLYAKVRDLEKNNENLSKFKDENEKLSKKNEKLKKELAHYIHLSNNLYVSSYFPDKRRKVGIEGNAIDMELNPEKSTTTNLHVLFPSAKEIVASKEQVEELLEPKARRAGEELVDDIMDEFGDLLAD